MAALHPYDSCMLGGNYDRTVTYIRWKYPALDSGSRKGRMADADRKDDNTAWRAWFYLDCAVPFSAVF